MGSIKDKANYLLDTKTLIRSTLVTLGVDITEDMPFREYPNFLKELVPKTETVVLGTMQIQNRFQVHMQGDTSIVPITELEEAYKMFQHYAALQTPELLKGD